MQGELLCTNCLTDAVIAKPAACPLCNVSSSLGSTCRRCQSATALAGVTVVAHYDGAIKQLVLRTKFSSYRAGAKLMARLMATKLVGMQFDLVTAVPTTALRRRQRGYNQAELMARELALQLGIPYLSLLGRRGKVRQMGTSRSERLKQLNGSFYPLRKCQGLRILVVDDVLTTGATLSECANELSATGASHVWAVALAKH